MQNLFVFKKFNTFNLRYDGPFILNFCYRLPKNFLLLKLRRKKKFFFNNEFFNTRVLAGLAEKKANQRLVETLARSPFSLFFSKLKKSRKALFLTALADSTK